MDARKIIGIVGVAAEQARLIGKLRTALHWSKKAGMATRCMAEHWTQRRSSAECRSIFRATRLSQMPADPQLPVTLSAACESFRDCTRIATGFLNRPLLLEKVREIPPTELNRSALD